MFIFNVTDATGATSGYPHVRVYDSRGRLKGMGGTPVSGVTSVGLSMPSPVNPAFTVTNSPVTSTGVLTVTANGTASQYIDGTGALQTFPTGYTYTVDNGLTENPAGNFQLGGTLIQNTTITGANFNFTYTGLNRYLVDVDDFVNISSVSGADVALVDVSTGGATPYVELNVKNGVNTHSIYVDDAQIILRTPGVDAGSVTNGDVLTLIDATSGEVEFQTPAVTGTPVALPFTADHIAATSNPYVIGDVVWYSGNIYICIANNDSILPTNTSYWTSLGAGNPLVQQPADWNSTSGNNQILNKPTIPTAQGLQDVIITDPLLTQNNTINGNNFNLTFGSNNRFSVVSDQFIDLTSDNGTTDTAAVEINTQGAEPFVDIQVKNGVDTIGITVDTSAIFLRTPGIDGGTALLGDVLTLMDPVSGEAEWQTPTGGGGGLEYGIAAGTNTYTVTIAGVTGYVDGDTYAIKFTNGNDDDSTININGLGAKTLTKQANIQVTGGDIVSGQELILIYDGTNFQCIGVAPNQLFAYVTNDDSVTITKGQPVYAFGSAGNRMSVKLAYNTSDATSAQTVGLVFSTSIAAGQKGFIITQGVISGVNTGAYSPGDTLYLGATAGTLTSTKPFAPNHLVYIGTVERANAGNGQIYVRPQNGFEMNELHDVQSNGAVNNDILYRDTTVTPNLWKPASIPTILGYTPADINSPAFTGIPTAPTAPSGTNTTQIATTAFVQTAVEQSSSLVGVFGDGGSGNATITGSISLTADAYYNDLTISGAGSIFLNGYRLFVKGTLDISNAGSLAIHNSGFTGDAATGVTAGNNSGAGTVGRGGYGVTTTGWFSGGTGSGVVYRGGNGGGGASINTNNATTGGTSPASTQMVAGGFGGAGGKGGNSSVGTGANGGSGQSSSQSPSTFYIRTFIPDQGRIQLNRFNTTGVSATQSSAGAFHGGGGGGAGSSTIALGGSGAAGGGGGGITIVYARQIVVGAGTAADAIASRGGDGGGVTFAGNANAGGGGGGAGGGGGYIYLVYGTITGGSYTFASANGGTGGKGGNGQGTGFGGQGGQGGSGGRITAISLGYNTITVVDGTANLGTVPAIPVTTTGSLGGAGGTCTFSS